MQPKSLSGLAPHARGSWHRVQVHLTAATLWGESSAFAQQGALHSCSDQIALEVESARERKKRLRLCSSRSTPPRCGPPLLLGEEDVPNQFTAQKI